MNERLSSVGDEEGSRKISKQGGEVESFASGGEMGHGKGSCILMKLSKWGPYIRKELGGWERFPINGDLR